MSKSNEVFMAVVNGEYQVITWTIFEFSNVRGNQQYQRIVFVEGESDKKFYDGNLYKCLEIPKTQVRYICNRPQGGKDSVIRAYRFVNSKAGKDLKRCVFIVDRDYNDLDEASKYLQPVDLNHITILPCYSFENYYIYKENLKSLIYDMAQDEGEQHFNLFWAKLEVFLEKINDYCALKKTIVKHDLRVNQIKPLDDHLMNWETSAALEFTDFNANDINNVAEAIRSMGFYEQYLKSKRFLRENPNRIKGKILFEFLLKYIQIEMNMKLHRDALYQKGAFLSIDLDVKTGG